MAITRRKFLGMTAVAAASTVLPWRYGAREAIAANSSPQLAKWAAPARGLLLDMTGVNLYNTGTLPAGSLKWLTDPTGIPCLPFPLFNPDPVFDAKSNPFNVPLGAANLATNLSNKETMWGASMYNINAAEFTDTLHPNMGGTTKLWGYSNATTGVKRHLAGVIISVRGFGNRLRFTNKLTADGTPTGAPLQHLLPNDKLTIPGANEGDNKLAVHLHGGWMPWIHDGGPFDWWKPNSSPAVAGSQGASFENGTGGIMDNIVGNPIGVGQADYFYPNLTSSRLIWYHDHAFGITRINAYAGIATGYLTLDPLQELSLNKTLERVATYTNLLDPVFKRLLGLPLIDPVTGSKDLDTATRGAVVAAVTNAAPKIPSILSTIPVVIQQKKFVSATTAMTDPTWAPPIVRADVQSVGSMWYEHIYDPKEFKLLKGGPYLPPPNPSAVPEFVGDTTMINGTISPFMEVEPKPYRFLFLNATQAQGYNLNLLRLAVPGGEVPTDPKTNLPVVGSTFPGPPTYIIGTEGGYLSKEVLCNNNTFLNPLTFTGNMVFLGGERLDVVVDFTGFADGTEFVFYNDAVAPFPAGPPKNDYYAGNNNNPAMKGVLPGTTIDTRNILKIRIKGPVSVQEPQPAAGMIPANLPRVWDAFEVSYAGYGLNALTGRYNPLAAPAGVTRTRQLTLNETFDANGRLQQLVGGMLFNPLTNGFGLLYLDPVTETVNVGYNPPATAGTPGTSVPTLEVWQIHNTTADTHPMHFHMSNVQILSRQPFTVKKGIFTPTPGLKRGPEPYECGWKEVCQMHPGEIIEVLIKWELPPVPFGPIPVSKRIGGYETVWHCHILEHEEHDMMRPIQINGTNPWW